MNIIPVINVMKKKRNIRYNYGKEKNGIRMPFSVEHVKLN